MARAGQAVLNRDCVNVPARAGHATVRRQAEAEDHVMAPRRLRQKNPSEDIAA